MGVVHKTNDRHRPPVVASLLAKAYFQAKKI
jgi:hypothetical protein